MNVAMPLGVPVIMMVPFLSVVPRTQMLKNGGYIEDHVVNAGGLSPFHVDEALQYEVSRLRKHLGRRDDGYD